MFYLNTHYAIELKRKICQDICLNGKSTMKTANEYGIPLKTVENELLLLIRIIIALTKKILNWWILLKKILLMRICL